MTRAFLKPIPEAEATRTALAAAVPELETERLLLRAPELSDWDVLEPIWTTDRAVFIDGPHGERDAWLDFAQCVASWLLRGLGFWTVTQKADGAVLGLVGIAVETTDPEPEFGWLLTAEAEGNGYAFEAAKAVRAYAFETLGMATLVSFVDRRNDRSAALARKLGATEDRHVLSREDAQHTLAFRHRSPS